MKFVDILYATVPFVRDSLSLSLSLLLPLSLFLSSFSLSPRFLPSYISFPCSCPATSQPFLRRFESRASRRNALMRTWLPSYFPPSSSRATPTVPTAVTAVTVTVATLGLTEHQKRERSLRTLSFSLLFSFSSLLFLDLHDNK